MYIPKAFEQPSVVEMYKLIGEYSFATLVVVTDAGIEANHLPFLIRDDGSECGVLVGHVARSNSMWKTFKADQEVLVIFNGPDAYISPSWYATKQEHGRVVPTWNYAVVHARGFMRIVEDGEWLFSLLNDLTTKHEAQFEQPWAIADAPADYIEKLSSAIVGVEIPVSGLMGKWKLSQNHPEQNQLGVVEGLQKTLRLRDGEMAELMKSVRT
jgi:transcriptional regulator